RPGNCAPQAHASCASPRALPGYGTATTAKTRGRPLQEKIHTSADNRRPRGMSKRNVDAIATDRGMATRHRNLVSSIRKHDKQRKPTAEPQRREEAARRFRPPTHQRFLPPG